MRSPDLSVRIHALRNPAGGTRSTRLAAAQAIGRLRGAGHEVIELTGASPRQSSDELAAAIGAGRIERLLVAGGDGLVNLAIQQLATTDIPLSIAATGTGNDFAAALGGTASPLEVAVESPPVPVDLLRVSITGGHRWVASIAIAGFPADINSRANAMSLPLGPQLYTVAAVRELPSFARLALDVVIDGTARSLDSAMLAIGNTRFFGGGMLACPDASATDGLLHVTSIEGVGRLGVLRHLVGRTGGTADRKEVFRKTAQRIDVTTQGVEFWGDGELIGMSPLSIDIVPRALRVSGISKR